MMKKIFVLLLALAMAFSLFACSGNNNDADSTDGADSTGDTIKLGWYGPLSGSAASVGTSGETAAKLAVKQINENGGILGKQIELIEYDDEGNYETSVKCATRLVEQDHVIGIVGSHLSSSVLATSDVTEEAKVVQFGTGTSEIWTNIGLSYTFRPTCALPCSIMTATSPWKRWAPQKLLPCPLRPSMLSWRLRPLLA